MFSFPGFTGILSPMVVRQSGGLRPSDEGGHFAPSLLYTASKLYYEEDATQAEIAVKLHTSRATVSRLLSEARRQGIVRIEVIAPGHDGSADLAARVSAALGLQAVHISGALPASTAAKPVEDVMGSVLAPAVSRALAAVGLVRGDILLVSSGRTMSPVTMWCSEWHSPAALISTSTSWPVGSASVTSSTCHLAPAPCSTAASVFMVSVRS